MTLGVVLPPNTAPIKASAIQAPSQSGANTKQVLSQLKEGMEIAQRLRGSVGDSYVRVSELVALGLGTIVNGNLQLSNGGVVGGGGTPPSSGGSGSGGPGATGATGAQGPQGVPGEDGRDGEDGLTIVGPQGPIGAQGDIAPIFWPDDPEDPLIIPGSTGATGVPGLDAPIIWPDDPDDAQVIPGPAGAEGAAGAQGPPGISGFPIFVEPDDPDDPLVVPGPVGSTGPTGSTGATGAAGANAPIIWPDDPDDAQVIPGPAGAIGPTGPQGPAGSGGGGGGYSTPDDWDYPEELPWRDIPQTCDINIWSAPQVFESTGLNEGAVTIQGTNALLQFNNSTPNVIGQIGTYEGWLGSGSDSTDFAVGAIYNLYLFAGDEIYPSLAVLGISAPTLKGWGPTAAALVDMTPDRGDFTITASTGLTTTPSGTAYWARVGNLVFLTLPELNGTSNATTFKLTGLPAAIQPTNVSSYTSSFPAENDNNGVTAIAATSVSSGTLTLTIVTGIVGTGAWTNSGTKGIPAVTIMYQL